MKKIGQVKKVMKQLGFNKLLFEKVSNFLNGFFVVCIVLVVAVALMTLVKIVAS